MITSEALFWLIGLLFLAFATLIAADAKHPKRWTSAAFWGLIGFSFIYGTWVQAKQVPAWTLGAMVLAMVVLGSSRKLLTAGVVPTTSVPQREASAKQFGNKLFIPALCIPVVAVLVTLLAPVVKIGGTPLIDPTSGTLIGLGLGAVVALLVGLGLLKPKPSAAPLFEGRRILETIGWAAILPQMLSILGILFTQAGVGTAVGKVMGAIVPDGVLIFAVIAYCVGMALFTVLMGNAFAAFPIMTAAIGWPLLILVFHGNPATVFAVGMLAGFCGTLTTPMAANFNLVPPALLEMKNRYGVIRAQLPTAGCMLVANIAIMFFFGFPK
ncbi:DUF979 domain-containing protein [Paenarthrobacter sp. Z7-10]|uniref:DUF979 domain-containing protein n=1 Tax=Paenarthrobacter sp. Z7-10 TaxID=2787635 RepID=UPI0022A90417|nr:DUF979 domain-containing protein [Paenarthrobacter sp. Z7-10]MCZ2401932.1 DUF979 domain-containing protein [Paenarthrobacter sp. Z7-10]